jgi:hypothetical protein
MRPETEARIRTVQKFGKNARQFCALAATLFGITLVASWAQIVSGPRLADTNVRLGTNIIVNSDQLVTVSSKIWAFVVATVVLGLLLWMLFHLYRLFKQLEAGSIYTKQNVYHLRQVGWLSMALAVIQLVLPLVSLGLAQIGFIDSTFVTFAAPADGSAAPASGAATFTGQSLAGLITASLILLASWIMDVGQQISDDAEAMRREADLVI